MNAIPSHTSTRKPTLHPFPPTNPNNRSPIPSTFPHTLSSIPLTVSQPPIFPPSHPPITPSFHQAFSLTV